MSLTKRALRRLRALFRRNEVERDLDDELRFHLEMEQRKNERLGMMPDDARRAARVAFGGVDRYKEEARDARGVGVIENLIADVRYSLRGMRKSPGFATVVILTIALGVGATSAIFSIVNAVLLRPLPYGNWEQLVRVYSQDPSGKIDRFSVSVPDFDDFRRRNRAFSDMAAWVNGTMTLFGEGEPQRLSSVHATENLFSLMGVRPLLGRLFVPGDASRDDEIVLSYGLWVRQFGADSSVINRQIKVNATTKTIVGVLPESFRLYTRDVDVWTAIDLHTLPKHDVRAHHLLRVFATLKPGVTRDVAQRDMRRVAAELAAEYPKANEGWTSNVFFLRDEIVGDARRPLEVLLAASALVLLIACINVANLQLTRASGRGRELAVRRALGASRSRIVSQLLAESLVLSVIGGLLGLGVGLLGTRALIGLAPEGQVSRLDEVSLDGNVLAFTLLVAVVTGLLFGLWPALRSSDPQSSSALRDAGRSSIGTIRPRVRRTLVVAEVSLALVLLVGAGLVIQSFRKMLDVDFGFKAERTITLRVTLPASYPDSAQTPFYRELEQRLEARPGIIAVSASDRIPTQAGGISTDIRLLERPDANKSGSLYSSVAAIVPNYFRTMRMTMLRGRDVRWNEKPPAIVVNSAAAEKFWPGTSALGMHIGFGRRMNDSGFVVVGVVADTRRGDITVPEEPMIYLPLEYAADIVRTMSVVVRGAGSESATIATARNVVHELDASLPIYDVRTVGEIVEQTVSQRRLNTTLLTAFAALALLLAIVGIYGVVSYSVTQRTRELGVRMALGARSRDVFSLVVREGMMLAVIGVVIGGIGTRWLTPVLRSWLYGVEPGDALTFFGVAVLLVIIAVLASAIPARRASRVDPVLAMRGE